MRLATLTLLLLLPGGDPVEEGLAHFAAAEYAKAAAAFRKALEAKPDDPQLNYNLALALWRGGEFDAAETAAEKAAAMGGERFEGLRDALVGNLRYDAARKGSPEGASQENLEKALGLARQARSLCEKGAARLVRFGSVAEVVRNLERAIRLEKELEERLEQEKQKQEQQKKDQKPKQDDQKKDDQQDPKKDEGQKGETEDPDQDKDRKQDPKDGNEPKEKEPEPDEKEKPGEKDEKQGGQQPPQEQQDVPGEHDPDQELTPEQKQKLLKRLEEFEKQLQQIKAAQRSRRPPVKKDW